MAASHVPLEILDMVFEHVSDERSLALLCRVSRLFRDRIRPRLYDDFSPKGADGVGFLRSICSNSELAKLVQDVNFGEDFHWYSEGRDIPENDKDFFMEKCVELGITMSEGLDMTADTEYGALYALFFTAATNASTLGITMHDNLDLRNLPAPTTCEFLPMLEYLELLPGNPHILVNLDKVLPLLRAPNLNHLAISQGGDLTVPLALSSLQNVEFYYSSMTSSGMTHLLGSCKLLESFQYETAGETDLDYDEVTPRQIISALRQSRQTLGQINLKCATHEEWFNRDEWDRWDINEPAEAEPIPPDGDEERQVPENDRVMVIRSLQHFTALEFIAMEQSCFWRSNSHKYTTDGDGDLLTRMLPESLKSLLITRSNDAYHPQPLMVPNLMQLALAAVAGEFPNLEDVCCLEFDLGTDGFDRLVQAFREANITYRGWDQPDTEDVFNEGGDRQESEDDTDKDDDEVGDEGSGDESSS